MKKILSAIVASLLSITICYGQWSGTTGDIHNTNGGNVGINTTVLPSYLSVNTVNSPSTNAATSLTVGSGILSDLAGSYLYPFEVQHNNTGNIDRFQINPYRRVAGSNWPGTAYRLQFAVDNSFTNGSKAFIEVGASDPNSSGGGFISLGTESTDRLTVQSSGNVGIGTTSPMQKLHVDGNISAGAAVAAGYNKYLIFQRSSDGYMGGQIGNLYEMSGYKGSLVFEVNNGGGTTTMSEAMRINSYGNVGIGTKSPDEKLTVNGTIHSTEVKVNLSVPAPDYVFDKSYDLKSLSDIQSYIIKNKHLPDVPSATEMAKDGLKVGDMNMLLLKKVEELTLYLIDKDKQVTKQQKDIEQLQKQLNQLIKEVHKN